MSTHFQIEFSNVNAVPQDKWIGKLLAGGLKWNCLSEIDEAPISFYREVTEVIASDAKTLTLATVKKYVEHSGSQTVTVVVGRMRILLTMQYYRDFTDCFVEANIKLRVEPADDSLKRDENIQFNRRWTVPWNVNFPNPRPHTIVQSGKSLFKIP